MFRREKLLNMPFKSQNRKMEKYKFHFKIIHLFLCINLLFIHCLKDNNTSDAKNTIGLLGVPEESQSSTDTEGDNHGEVLPPIPPVVGLPAPPGQPLNAPILNQPQILVENTSVNEDPSGFFGKIFIDQISFQLPVHNQTTITAYIGKRNLMLKPDGTVINAANFKTLTPINPNGGAFWFNFRIPSDQKQKLILVARNEFGTSFKEIEFSHNRNCIGAPLVPIIIGNCDPHCFEITNTAGLMEFKSKLKHDEITYLEFEIFGLNPKTAGNLLVPNSFSYIWDDPAFPPLQPGITSIKTTLNQEGKDNICIEIQSLISQEDGNGNFTSDFYHSRVRLE